MHITSISTLSTSFKIDFPQETTTLAATLQDPDPNAPGIPIPGQTYPVPGGGIYTPPHHDPNCSKDSMPFGPDYETEVACWGVEEANKMEHEKDVTFMTGGFFGGALLGGGGVLIAAAVASGPPGWVGLGIVAGAAVVGIGVGWVLGKIF